MEYKEQVEFSKARLGLAVLTAPKQAFEEIVERRLIGSAFVITALAGLLGLIWKLMDYHKGNGSLYEISRYNPIMSIAYLLTISLGVHTVARIMGGKGRLTDTVIGLGWINIIGALGIAGLLIEQSIPMVGGIAFLMMIWVVLVRVIAVDRIYNIGLVKSAFASLLGLFPVAVLESFGYAVARGVHPSLNVLTTVAGSKPVSEPIYLWGVAVISAVALYMLLKQMDWKPDKRAPLSVGMFAAMALFAIWSMLLNAFLDPVGHMKSGVTGYETGNYRKAETELKRVLEIFPKDFAPAFYLGHSYLSAGDYAQAEKQFSSMLKGPRPSSGMDAVRVRTALGAVYYADGNYKKAISEFDNALKQWPNYREALTRKSLTLIRMGKTADARKIAEESLGVGADSAVPHVVLSETYATDGNDEKAKEHIGMVKTTNPALADAISRSSDNWKDATVKVSPEFLKYPLDTEPARIVHPRSESQSPKNAKKQSPMNPLLPAFLQRK